MSGKPEHAQQKKADRNRDESHGRIAPFNWLKHHLISWTNPIRFPRIVEHTADVKANRNSLEYPRRLAHEQLDQEDVRDSN